MRRITRQVALVATAAAFMMLASPTAGAATLDDACIADATAAIAAAPGAADLDGLVAEACAASGAALRAEAARQGLPSLASVPVLTWASVGVQADGALAGFPVVAVCQIGVAFVNPTNTQFVMGTAAAAVGPATKTTVNCGGYGMQALGESLLPVAAAADTVVGPLVAGSLCVVGRGYFIGQATATTTRTPAGCTPDITITSTPAV